jgi:hypothetical protein
MLFMRVRLLMIFMKESLFLVFTKRRWFMLVKLHVQWINLNKLILYYFYSYIFYGNFGLLCGSGTDFLSIHTFPRMLERTDAIMKEVLEPITFVLAYPTVLWNGNGCG